MFRQAKFTIYLFVCPWKSVESQGKVSEKSGNFVWVDCWQPCRCSNLVRVENVHKFICTVTIHWSTTGQAFFGHAHVYILYVTQTNIHVILLCLCIKWVWNMIFPVYILVISVILCCPEACPGYMMAFMYEIDILSNWYASAGISHSDLLLWM